MNSEDAWHLSTGVLACVQDPIAPISNAWNGRIISADLYFSPHQDEQHALASAGNILPADIQQVGSFDGVNNDASSIPGGSCKQIVYRSDTFAAAARQANPQWTGSFDKVSVTLYTGNSTASDGSDRGYNVGDIHLALVDIGGENKGSDGIVHC
ncbi:hypothetical protein ABIA39_007505 [Nocardia sp. GAS34]|uniref:hypothetical protein n=1 Tax=unclassified Nocardia TaxID=2637762 RepID=UPI003D20FA9A